MFRQPQLPLDFHASIAYAKRLNAPLTPTTVPPYGTPRSRAYSRRGRPLRS